MGKLDWSCTSQSAVLASSPHYMWGWLYSSVPHWRVLFFITEFTLGMILPTKASVGQELAAEQKLSGNTVQVCWLEVWYEFSMTINVVPTDFAVVKIAYSCGHLQKWKPLGWNCLLTAVIRAWPVTAPGQQENSSMCVPLMLCAVMAVDSARGSWNSPAWITSPQSKVHFRCLWSKSHTHNFVT